jgi:anti-anti-sigma factor
VPLYACERCRFTSAAVRPEAAAAHRLDYRDCDGVIRIVFRSGDRSRGQTYELQTATAPAARDGELAEALPAAPARAFALRERLDADETLCVTLLGDLDLAVADRLTAWLAELKAAFCPVRLDRSRLAFIDSTGVRALLAALTDARWTGWRLDVAPEVNPSVERAAQIVGIARVLWPQDPGTRRGVAAPIAPRPHEPA